MWGKNRHSVKDIEDSDLPHFMTYLCLGQHVFRVQFTSSAHYYFCVAQQPNLVNSIISQKLHLHNFQIKHIKKT